MSTVTIGPEDLVSLDASDKKAILFDFDAVNLPVGVTLTSYVVTITAIQQASTALTYDSDAITGGSRKVIVRLLATTASLGDRYRVSVKGVTNESPVQEKEYSIYVVIENH